MGLGGGAALNVGLHKDDLKLRPISLGVSGSHQHARFEIAQDDQTGNSQISSTRMGWTRHWRGSADAPASLLAGGFGMPLALLGSAAFDGLAGGGSSRVITERRNGSIVPEKTNSDTQTWKKSLFKKIVAERRDEWIENFASKYVESEPDPVTRKILGRADLDAYMHNLDHVRKGNQAYVARERLHSDVATRLDELASMAALIPDELAAQKAEIEARRAALMADDRSWIPTVLLMYETTSRESGKLRQRAGYSAHQYVGRRRLARRHG